MIRAERQSLQRRDNSITGSNASVEFVVEEPEGDQSIHIEQVDHGKFAKISSTSLLINVGGFGPALRTVRPVTGSVASLAR
jgi:hypothetical protein